MNNIKPNFNLFGHRGAAGLRPENTLLGFAYAAQLGLNWIEFDVQLTSDDKWVVIHDTTLERTTNGHGNVVDHTLAELSLLEAGLWFQPSYPDEHIPTLEVTLDLCAKLGLQANIELKGSEQDPFKYANLLANLLKERFNKNPNKPLLSSFDLASTLLLRQLLPDFPVGLLIENYTEDTIDVAREHNLNSINCDVKTINHTNLKASLEQNIPVFLYTINDLTTAKYWFDQGVAAIFTDRPDLLQKG